MKGSSWNFRDSDTLKTQWTGSIVSGGHWNTLYSASQVFDQEAADMRMDVTNLVLLQLKWKCKWWSRKRRFHN